ncbi:MAG: hypothetical protein C3F13_11905 [Anaerolineales bacterium]|nr:PDZ domain-containing protein [Anaerolineae bacterium]PWB52226.1 MAG: hypothetical protein C3F13_11905 [Anaerolineales bacterium]
MKPDTRPIFLLPIILVLVSCQALIPRQSPTPEVKSIERNLIEKPLPGALSTETPVPTVTYSPTSTQEQPTATQSVTGTPTQTQIPLSEQQSIFDDLWNVVNDTYVYPDFNGVDWNSTKQEISEKISAGLSTEDFYREMKDLIISLGDDHSYYLDPQEVAAQDAEYEGSHDYVGIGIYVSAVPERARAVIISVFPNSPAEQAGLQPRDSILSVDGTPILDEDGYLRDIVRGPEGTSIAITVQTPGEQPREMRLTRQRITSTYPVTHQVITTPEGMHIGYVFLLTFMDGTVDEQVADALKEMNIDEPLDGLIIDNRMNEGGSSLVLEPMLGYFTSGTLGYFVRHSTETPLKIKLNDVNNSAEVPMVVLVGSGTASFGEIFSGILQDTGRAYVIGTTTDGNVEILWGYDFEDGSELWLANETFRPANHTEQDWEQSGIVPDLTVPAGYDEYTFQTDPLILAAVQYFSNQ